MIKSGRRSARHSRLASSGPRSIRGGHDLGFDGDVLGGEAGVDGDVLARGLDLVHGRGGDGGSPDVDARQLGQGRELV